MCRHFQDPVRRQAANNKQNQLLRSDTGEFFEKSMEEDDPGSSATVNHLIREAHCVREKSISVSVVGRSHASEDSRNGKSEEKICVVLS